MDPVRARRARIGRLAALGRRAGFGLFGAAMAIFVVSFLTRLTAGWVDVIVACMVVGSILLAPSIVIGYAVRAAEREDREQGR